MFNVNEVEEKTPGRAPWAGWPLSSVFTHSTSLRGRGLSPAQVAGAIVMVAGVVRSSHAGGTGGIWISPQELAALPMQGAAWQSLLAAANAPPGVPLIANQDDATDVHTMAKALVYARTGQAVYRQQVITTCMAAMGTEVGGLTLALGRNLIGYIIAADLVGLPPDEEYAFRSWLNGVRYENLQGLTLISTHEHRPNNWGTHAGASRMAIDVYLGDFADLQAAANVFKGWLGDRNAYAGFDYGDLWWQADPAAPVGINPSGSTILGFSVDGVLPDDQRRGGPFLWPPPQVNYVYEALQGAVAEAEILHRQGYDAWNWQNHALRRAFTWLHAQAGYPAQGDDTWQPHLVNFRYGTTFPAPIPSNPGKNVGWTDWTHTSACPWDLDGDNHVSTTDMLIVLSHWGCAGFQCPGDIDGNHIVGVSDLLAILAHWGNCG